MSENPPAHAAHTALRAGRRQTGHSLPLVLADSESFPVQAAAAPRTIDIYTLYTTDIYAHACGNRQPAFPHTHPPWAPRSVTRRTICDTMYSLFAGEKLIADNAEYLATQHPHIRIRHHFKIGNALVEGQDRKYIFHNTLYLHKENKCIRGSRCLKHEYIIL